LVYLIQKCFPAGVRLFSEHRGGTLRHAKLARLASPAADIAIGDQRQLAQITGPARPLQVIQQIV